MRLNQYRRFCGLLINLANFSRITLRGIDYILNRMIYWLAYRIMVFLQSKKTTKTTHWTQKASKLGEF